MPTFFLILMLVTVFSGVVGNFSQAAHFTCSYYLYLHFAHCPCLALVTQSRYENAVDHLLLPSVVVFCFCLVLFWWLGRLLFLFFDRILLCHLTFFFVVFLPPSFLMFYCRRLCILWSLDSFLLSDQNHFILCFSM